jgi:protein-disulfide isomerase/uncharacterized membrane protein
MTFSKSKKISLFVIAILGFLISIKLFLIYLDVNYNPYALASFCSINEIVDCDGVEKSMLSHIFGIPFACWGMFLYSVVILFIFVDKLKKIKILRFLEVFKNPQMYIAALGYIALTLSLILAITAYIQIKKICLLCGLTYLVDLALGLVATEFKDGGILKVFKTSIDDLIDGVKIPKYGISLAICVSIFVGFLFYTNSTYVFVPHLKMKRDVKKFEKLVNNNPYKIKGNVFGDENAKITILLFTDYECPICQINNVMLNKAVKDVKGLKIEHKNFPLDIKCNDKLSVPFHEHACLYAKYAVAAEKQGKWGEMNDFLFKSTPNKEKTILKNAQKMGFDVEKLKTDAHSVETLKQIKKDLNLGFENEISGTPAMIINGKKISGLKSYDNLIKILKNARDGKEIDVEK